MPRLRSAWAVSDQGSSAEAMLAHALQQRLPRSLRVRAESGPLESRIAPSRRSRSASIARAARVEPHAALRSIRSANSASTGGVDRRGGKNARTRRHALRLRHRQPFGAGERGRRIELEPAPARRSPGLARSVAAPGDPIGKASATQAAIAHAVRGAG
jgi:hypothetical protein